MSISGQYIYVNTISYLVYLKGPRDTFTPAAYRSVYSLNFASCVTVIYLAPEHSFEQYRKS